MKVDYGVDAPGVVWTLFAVSVVGLIAGILLRVFAVLSAIAFVGGGVVFLLFLSMAGYVMGGKLRFRDYMIGLVPWTGTETVLDIGTGRGLLLIAAAKKLSTGRAIGTDIWSAKDLSGNSPENTLLNARLEQMSDRVEVLTEDARKLSFASESIDVVLSLYCIHNIEDKTDQEQACREIARVLKPGGKVLLADYVPTHEYAKALREAGLQVAYSKAHILRALTLMWMVEATKPA